MKEGLLALFFGQDNMGRKLRHLLVFLLIILKEPSMPEAACRCKPSLRCICNNLGLISIPLNLPTWLCLLYLRNNQITMIQPRAFANLPRLETLCLDYNKITNIHTGTFENLPQLQRLHLYHNQLTKIQSGTFVNLPRLQWLALSHNQITMIQPGTFENLPLLQRLYLSDNQITMIQNGTFANLPWLERLFLDRNQIIMIQPGSFVNLPGLQVLYLYCNQLTMIQTGTFENLPELEKLYLYHNQLTMIESRAFANIPKLRHLDLRSNKMSSIPPFDVPTVKLGGNPWQCDCRMAPFRLIPTFNDQIICALPAKVQGQKLANVDPKEMICKEPHVHALNIFTSTTMSKSSSFRKTETNPGPTAHAVGSTLPIQTQAPFASSAVSESSFGDTESLSPGPRVKPRGSTFPALPSVTQHKVKTAATLAVPFPTTGTSSILFTANKPETNRYSSHESSPCVSIPTLIGSVCGSAALSIVAAVLITIWCKRNTKNPPSGPTSNIALSNISTKATVPTSGSLHDQTGHGQALASTQPLNIEQLSNIRGPDFSQNNHYERINRPPNPNITTRTGVPTTGSLAPHRDAPPLRDDDGPTYVEPDGAHYMTPEDVLYEMPANSH
ncbi:PREDICTED: chondroadherin-like [Branchiostoma belcheri]|uniref:Chondroadherin-like n=1 Tax=Branchiostoma belcheri TaxID=7741 RepID=A0A6P4YUL7_BRABE|nr:PREDICTED: chondroadherin-like [Branchiostoma belcheri]